MRASDVWRRIIGWQVGDFLSYLYYPSFSEGEGVWLKLRITSMSSTDDYVNVEIIGPKRYFGYGPFALRLSNVESDYPDHIRDYHPRKSTVKRLEDKGKIR